MTVSIFHRIQTKDFDTWLNPDPEVPAGMMKEQGALSMQLTRSLDDPNLVMIHCVFPDEATARAYVEFYKQILPEYLKQNPGAADDGQQWTVGENIDAYSRDF